MTSRFVDFDAARAERENEPLLLRAYGETIELPGSLPASLFLDVLRMEEDSDGDREFTSGESLALLRRILPGGVLDGLLAREDFSTDDFEDLIRLVMDAYTGAPGETPAPNRAQRRSKAPAKSTRSRGSRAGSTVPKAKTASASRGAASSNTGS